MTQPSLVNPELLSHGTLECNDIPATRRFLTEFLGIDVVRPLPEAQYLWKGGPWSVVCVCVEGEQKERENDESRTNNAALVVQPRFVWNTECLRQGWDAIRSAEFFAEHAEAAGKASIQIADHGRLRSFAEVRRRQAVASWTRNSAATVLLCFVLNSIDGIDVLLISYLAPSIAQTWHLNPSRLGVVFSSGLVGMAIGGIGLAPLADRFGRRKLILFSPLAIISINPGSLMMC